MIVHHHAIFVATVCRSPAEIHCDDLRIFLAELVKTIGMRALFEPIALQGKYGFTGIVGIVTSHIAFHFFDADQSLHLDVYSCKEFDLPVVARFVDQYWEIKKADIVFIKRDQGPSVERYTYIENQLTKEACI